jgi:triphosphoribosyl-dephospho-CoA synthase
MFLPLSSGAAATLASIYEATAPKPGNVYPGADFEDASYADFVASAIVIGPIIERIATLGVGETVLQAVRATRAAVGTNTNLGTLLLVAPLGAVPSGAPLVDGIGAVLDALTAEDTRCVYEAIRESAAGGLGRAEEADVFAEAPRLPLVEVMRLAAERDLVARQYTNRFADVFRIAAWIAENINSGWRLSAAIVDVHVRQLAAEPDSLVARKCGPAVTAEASRRASEVRAAVRTSESAYATALADLDAWLRADGNRRNPGTTADLIAAGLFVLLRDGRLHWTKW